MATDVHALQQRFAAQKFLRFDDVNGLVRVHVETKAATATVFLQGAHLAAWQPMNEAGVIFLSRKSEMAVGKPLRGGVPVVWPWFSGDKKKDRVDGHPGPSHGFGRIQDWTLESADLHGGDAELVFTLGPTEMSRRMGFDGFRLTLTMVFGKTLSMALRVKNESEAPLEFEEAFHAYFHVADVHEAEVRGLESAGFLDKTDDARAKPAEGKPVRFSGTVDRVYLDTVGPFRLVDTAGRRTIVIDKRNSRSTIVWNIFHEMPDIGEWDWHEYVCVETANVDRDAITLAAGAEHVMGMHVAVERGRA